MTFVDILGFADFVRDRSASDVSDMLDALGETAAQPLEGKGNTTSVVSFSDSVVRARPVGPESILDALLHEVQDLATAQWQLLELGMLIRGGTTVGDVSIAESRVFGPGFVQAYRLESALAGSPRIIIDPGVVESIRSHLSTVETTSGKSDLIVALRDHIRLGDDGVWFIDYVNSVHIVAGAEFVRNGLMEIRDFIISAARQFEDRPLILPKYLWQIRYHNASVRRLFPKNGELRIKAREVPASDELLKPARRKTRGPD